MSCRKHGHERAARLALHCLANLRLPQLIAHVRLGGPCCKLPELSAVSVEHTHDAVARRAGDDLGEKIVLVLLAVHARVRDAADLHGVRHGAGSSSRSRGSRRRRSGEALI